MKIIKYKKLSGNKYEVYLEDGNKIRIYEDIILKEGLLLKKEVIDINELLKKNASFEIYDISLKRLSHHVESVKGMRDYLQKKGYEKKDIDNTIDKLIEKGYLNDEYYAKCYVTDRINLSNDGPFKIIKHLEDVEIPSNIYYEYLDISSGIWQDKIKKYIDHNLKSNKKSLYFFKNKMLVNLLNLGYDKERINDYLSSVQIDNQQELMEKEKEKIRLKLSRKYSGKELEYKIKEKLYQKGFFE